VALAGVVAAAAVDAAKVVGGEEPVSFSARNHINDTELELPQRQLAPIFVDTRQQLA